MMYHIMIVLINVINFPFYFNVFLSCFILDYYAFMV